MTATEKDVINKFLTLAMGECWHKWVRADGHPFKCKLCGCSQYHYSLPDEGWPHPDFSTWTGFGSLWEWAQKQEWWFEFGWEFYPQVATIPEDTLGEHREIAMLSSFINPERFAIALYNFLKEKP